MSDRKWYWEGETSFFEDIVFLSKEEICDSSKNYHGSFKTFTEAKNDALEYFRTDIKFAKDAIRNIKEFKKKETAS